MQLPPTILSIDDKKSSKGATQLKAASNKTSSTKHSLKGNPKASKEPSVANPEVNESSEDELNDAASKMTVSRKGSGKLLPPRTLETTLFDRLEAMYGADIKRMLNVQYRSVTCYWEITLLKGHFQDASANLLISLWCFVRR